VIWQRFGDVKNYCELFAGFLAVLLGRPKPIGTETINDADGMLVNFWRACQTDPNGLVESSSILNSEIELRAWHKVLRESRQGLTARLADDVGYYDVRLAGAWLWGICNSIAEAWHRHTPQRPALSTHAQGTLAQPDPIKTIAAVAERLKKCRILCGDWTRCVTPERIRDKPVAVLLDPPYGEGDLEYAAGGNKTNLAQQVAEWAVENGSDPQVRIAYCGYEGVYAFPSTWTCHEWKAQGGFANQAQKEGRDNARRERIWFSPSCLSGERQPSLFD
jgi:site-specific DNA-adenine methylase